MDAPVSNPLGKSRGLLHTPIVIPAKAGIQYAAASRFISGSGGILDRPVKPGDDELEPFRVIASRYRAGFPASASGTTLRVSRSTTNHPRFS